MKTVDFGKEQTNPTLKMQNIGPKEGKNRFSNLRHSQMVKRSDGKQPVFNFACKCASEKYGFQSPHNFGTLNEAM